MVRYHIKAESLMASNNAMCDAREYIRELAREGCFVSERSVAIMFGLAERNYSKYMGWSSEFLLSGFVFDYVKNQDGSYVVIFEDSKPKKEVYQNV